MTTKFFFGNLHACSSALISELNLETQWLLDDLNSQYVYKYPNWAMRWVYQNRYRQTRR